MIPSGADPWDRPAKELTALGSRSTPFTVCLGAMPWGGGTPMMNSGGVFFFFAGKKLWENAGAVIWSSLTSFWNSQL